MKKGLAAIWVVVITVVVMLALVGGGYYYLNDQQKGEVSNLNDQIASLEGDVDNCKTSLAQKKECEEEASTSKTKTYTNSEGLFSFDYPSSWTLIENHGLGEGTGIAPVIITFAKISSIDAAVLRSNDLTIVMYPKRDNTTGGLTKELYPYLLENVASGTKSDITIGGVSGSKYSDLGGLASNPTKYIIKSGEEFVLEIENINSDAMLSEVVNDTELQAIIDSIKF